MKTQEIQEILNRIKDQLGLETDAEIAKRFGFSSPTTIYNWKIRGKIPTEAIITLCEHYQLSPAWVLWGIGPRTLRELDLCKEVREITEKLYNVLPEVEKLRQKVMEICKQQLSTF